MTRTVCALLALLTIAAAAPKRTPPPLPVPPIPPDHPPTAQIAPVPDRDAQAPSGSDSDGAKFTVRDFRMRQFNQGLGYAPGSQFETNEEKRSIQTPGVSVHVPLQ